MPLIPRTSTRSSPEKLQLILLWMARCSLQQCSSSLQVGVTTAPWQAWVMLAVALPRLGHWAACGIPDERLPLGSLTRRRHEEFPHRTRITWCIQFLFLRLRLALASTCFEVVAVGSAWLDVADVFQQHRLHLLWRIPEIASNH
jgi:hypothetical protein